MNRRHAYSIAAGILALAILPVAVTAQEVSPGGSIMHDYEGVQPDTSTPEAEAVHVEAIQDALEPFLGKNFVYHELVSQAAHIDVLVFAPTPKRNRWTLVTSGMSDKAMTIPAEYNLDPAEYGFAEIVMSVPADWFTKGPDGMVPEEQLKDPEKYWPIRTLKYLARFPHEYKTWFWENHTIPNGNPAEPFAKNTMQDGVMLMQLSDWPEAYRTVQTDDGTEVSLFAVVPLYPEEMQAKLDLGSDVLTPALLKAGVTELVQPTRQNVGPELLQ